MKPEDGVRDRLWAQLASRLDKAGQRRPLRGAVRLMEGPLRLDVLVSEVVELSRPLVRPPSAIHWTPCAAPVWIHGDAGQLTRMLLNLLKNSAESLEGAPEGARLAIEVQSTDQGVRVLIRDGGRGMDEATRKRMFEPFFSTKRSGCGLGLASVPAIVERHAGQIEVDSVGAAIQQLLTDRGVLPS